jgi:hypothetical protein
MRTEKQRSYGSVKYILLRNTAAQFVMDILEGGGGKETLCVRYHALSHFTSPDLTIDQGSQSLPVSQILYLQRTSSPNSETIATFLPHSFDSQIIMSPTPTTSRSCDDVSFGPWMYVWHLSVFVLRWVDSPWKKSYHLSQSAVLSEVGQHRGASP